MNSEIIIAVCAVVTLASGVLLSWIKMVEKINDVKDALGNRITRLETFIFLKLGSQAANILHSPHTPKLDSLLETYWRNNRELSNEQWDEVKESCDKMIKSNKLVGEKLASARFIRLVAEHKLGI